MEIATVRSRLHTNTLLKKGSSLVILLAFCDGHMRPSRRAMDTCVHRNSLWIWGEDTYLIVEKMEEERKIIVQNTILTFDLRLRGRLFSGANLIKICVREPLCVLIFFCTGTQPFTF